MKMADIPFGTTDWSVERTEHKGENGSAFWRTREVRRHARAPGRVHTRLPGRSLVRERPHSAVLEGELQTELEDGRSSR